MAYYTRADKKYSVSNFKNIENRCTCNSDFYTYIANPIRVILKEGKEPTLFKSTTNEPYDNKKCMSRGISFKGCICELDKISENYRVYGAVNPTQYNFRTLEIYKETKETHKRKHGSVSFEQEQKWAGR